MVPLFEYLSKQRRGFFVAFGTVFVLLTGIPDYLLGHGLSFSIFYLIPIMIAAWYAGRATGIYMAIMSAATWFAADELGGSPYGGAVPIWNAVVRLGFFLIVVYLLDAFKREKAFAREDYLTGLGNRRSFFERAESEIRRSQRYEHSFTVAYIDIDAFKAINDRFGHDEGDRLLRSVASVIKGHIRTTDIEARLGGDEFAVFLPENRPEAAQKFFTDLHKRLSVISSHDRPVTFSIGVVTFLKPPVSADEMIKTVDALMYNAKQSGKDQVKYQIVGSESSALSA